MKKYDKDFENIFGDELGCHQFLLPYRRAYLIMEAMLNGLNDEIKSFYEHSPIHSIKGRVKTPESIIDKLYRRGFEVSMNGVLELTDICGLRVICKYVDDIYDLRAALIAQPGVDVIRESDYVRNPKPNGYRSYHIILTIPVGNQRVPVEIQIRTIAMDMWASLEHNLYYKNDHEKKEEIELRLFQCSQMLVLLDEEIVDLDKELNENWKEHRIG